MFHSKSKQKLICIVFWLSTFLLAGCGLKEADLVPDDNAQSEIEQENAHNTFAALTNEMFMQEVTSDSITLHYTVASPQALGIPQQKATLGHIGEEVRRASIAKAKQSLQQLKNIAWESLPEKDRITYDLLKWRFETDISSETFAYFSESISPTIGIQAQLPILLAEYEFRCSTDIEDYILLLRQLPEYYEELISYEKEKASKGFFMSNQTADAVISQCEDFLCDVHTHYLTTSFDARIDALDWLSDEQKEQFKQINLTTMTSYVYPAYEALMDGLNALKETCTNEEGLCHFPEGKDYYAYLVKVSTGSESTPQELIKRTQKQMQTDLAAMSEIMDRNPKVLQTLAAVSMEASEPEATLTYLKEKMQEHFPAPPSVSCTVKYVDESMQKHLSPAFYLTPPIDRITENVIYINEPSFRDNIQRFTTLAHEGYPGHLYQNTFTTATKPDKVRSLLSFPGYAEGYATYAELFSYDYMGFDSDTAAMLKLSSSITLGIYASLDLGIHYEGWSEQQAKDFLYKYGIQDEHTAGEIFHAIVAEPANYLKYYVGYLEFLTLRDKAKDIWKEDYTDKKFHRYILEMGDAPFCILEKYLT